MKRLLRNFLCGLIVLSFAFANGQIISLYKEIKSEVGIEQKVNLNGVTNSFRNFYSENSSNPDNSSNILSENYLDNSSNILSENYPENKSNRLSVNHSNEWSFKPGGESVGNLYRESEGRVNLPSVPVFRLINILSKFQFINEMHKIDIDTFNSVACTGVVKENHSQRGFYIDLLCLMRI